MLELKNITKDYISGDSTVQALKGISIEFRKSEFVSILGQSGCGKTTLLNIIGGLDRYTSGDLVINGKSTKKFKDKDWDAYRNYSVGFVFQNYNLIPHQTILSNVELALTISGVSREERRERAIKALEDVGLKEQIHKKPNQLSGGQMQRVAIARALVNNPDIILADEPTGALDTKTSVQIMEILKKISKDKLIVMVTHNPELKEDTTNGVVQVNPSTVMNALGMGDMLEARENSSVSSMFGSSMTTGMSNTDVWEEMLDNEDLLHSQYDLVTGAWPENYNEVVLIVNENNEISDYTLYTLGLKDQKELEEKWNKVQNGETVEETESTSYTYEDLLNLSFKLILNSDYYEKENGLWIDKSKDEEYMKQKLDNCEEIKVVGIIKQNEQSVAAGMSGGIGYTKDLKEYVINKTNESEIVKEQKENPDINVFTGLAFPDNDAETFDYSQLSNEQRTKLATLSTEELAEIMETYSNNVNASYEGNLELLGAVDLNKPSSISIYPKDFDAKDIITEEIDNYNQKQRDEGKEENVINYTDLIGIMMSSVSQIIDTISYVLIAFVAISLIVSSIMIGIITYISVLERTKEIGILRAIGASKKDISRVFNAETFIVGLIAGLLGIGVTVLLNIPITKVIYAVTGVSVPITLPAMGGLILVLISMILTIIAGLIPAKMASKKDPVEALRTE